jgi:hypothetical protein
MNLFRKLPARRILPFAAAVVVAPLLNSCGTDSDSWLAGSMAAAANDQIMLVREQPPSFGFRRLEVQVRNYPDIAFFVKQRGVPDFLAETGSDDRRYFIFYYLKDRQAFACRTRPGTRNAVEFAGPYPITDREFRLLDGFQRDPSRRPMSL